MYNQERHVPAMQYKFKRERIVATLKEYMASPSFTLLGGCPTVASTTPSNRTTPSNNTAMTSLMTRPAGSATRYRFSRSNIVGDVAQQKKTFASLSSKCHSLPIRAITATNDDDDNADLIDLHDPEDQGSDPDQDFP